ncbi:hypothetical protein [Prevotella denticola]|uniref:hypothetical protein n=1 Tax=Prevotella denticola TaxID=28129 RepID=UPI0021515140|nr:hypothetical protein [Prevotella denticola]
MRNYHACVQILVDERYYPTVLYRAAEHLYQLSFMFFGDTMSSNRFDNEGCVATSESSLIRMKVCAPQLLSGSTLPSLGQPTA